MARAAAKRTPRPKPAPRPAPTRAERKANRSVEDTLFFSRLRGHAKWMFVLLAAVFGLGFVFFGVGSGSSGISDLLQGNFSNLFGSSSSGPSVSKALDKTKKNPKDAAAFLDLAHAYEAKKDDLSAISALESYTRLRPKDVNGLSELVGLYQNRAQVLATSAQSLQSAQQTNPLPTSFGAPATSVLGQALQDPINSLITSNPAPDPAYTQILGLLQNVEKSIAATYLKLTQADPTDPNSLIAYAQAAQQTGDSTAAVAAYTKFLKLFPDDPSAPAAKAQLKRLTGKASGSASG